MTARSVLVFGICILSSITSCATETAEGSSRQLQCHKCSQATTIPKCDDVETCSLGEVCYLQVAESPAVLFVPAETLYDGGCIQPSKCHEVEQRPLISGGLFVHHRLLCGGCCNGTECNKYLCDIHKKVSTTNIPTTTATTTTTTTTTTTSTTTTMTTTLSTTTTVTTTTSTTSSTTTPPTTLRTTAAEIKVNYCMKCLLDGLDWDCSHTEQCDETQVCFVQKLQLSVPSLHRTYYHGGCIKKTECANISHTSVDNEHGLADVVQGDCCFSKDCNRQIMQKYEGGIASTTGTPPHAVTTTGDVTTTIRPSGIASTTGTPPHAVTITGDVTTTIRPNFCEVCSGGLCGLLPGSGSIVQCPEDLPFCLNTVVNNDNGRRNYTKRCATSSDCRIKWWNESSDKADCVGFKPLSVYNFAFICSYCCITDRCNTDVFPAQKTLFDGST